MAESTSDHFLQFANRYALDVRRRVEAAVAGRSDDGELPASLNDAAGQQAATGRALTSVMAAMPGYLLDDETRATALSGAYLYRYRQAYFDAFRTVRAIEMSPKPTAAARIRSWLPAATDAIAREIREHADHYGVPTEDLDGRDLTTTIATTFTTDIAERLHNASKMGRDVPVDRATLIAEEYLAEVLALPPRATYEPLMAYDTAARENAHAQAIAGIYEVATRQTLASIVRNDDDARTADILVGDVNEHSPLDELCRAEATVLRALGRTSLHSPWISTQLIAEAAVSGVRRRVDDASIAFTAGTRIPTSLASSIVEHEHEQQRLQVFAQHNLPPKLRDHPKELQGALLGLYAHRLKPAFDVAVKESGILDAIDQPINEVTLQPLMFRILDYAQAALQDIAEERDLPVTNDRGAPIFRVATKHLTVELTRAMEGRMKEQGGEIPQRNAAGVTVAALANVVNRAVPDLEVLDAYDEQARAVYNAGVVVLAYERAWGETVGIERISSRDNKTREVLFGATGEPEERDDLRYIEAVTMSAAGDRSSLPSRNTYGVDYAAPVHELT